MSHPNEEQRTAMAMADLEAISIALALAASMKPDNRKQLEALADQAKNHPFKIGNEAMERAFRDRLHAIYSTAAARISSA